MGSADGVMAREANGVRPRGDAITLEVAARHLEADAITCDVVPQRVADVACRVEGGAM